jgi:putative FmdB family regulatory protein
MPIYDIECQACGRLAEVLVTTPDDPMVCPTCGGPDITKVMSATSSLTGRSGTYLPGSGDRGCCGRPPEQAACAGPGSCCGKTST